MALRSGYYGVKKSLLNTINALAGSKVIKSIGNGLALTNAGALSTDIDTNTMEYLNGKLAAKSVNWDYSTSEVDTGQKWVDGRTIYCKVIALESAISTTAGSWTTTGVSSADMELLLGVSVVADACTNLRGSNKVGSTEQLHVQAYYGTISAQTMVVYYVKPAASNSTRGSKKKTA